MTTTSKPAPPPAAVAADAHWAAKMDRLRTRKLAQAVFRVCDDPEVRERYARAVRAEEVARTYADANPDDKEAATEAAAAAAKLAEAKTAYEDVSVPLTFRALPRPAYEALLKEHKPSEEQADDGREWDDTFPAALIAAASVDGMTEPEAQELLDTWSLAEANDMFNAAFSVQHTTRTDLGKG
ncbi:MULTISPECIES: hypothetical protein [unclassified Streptomyces]|uniref:hypothetical protein n=1 Tax=unclassified Streptomyces TaxID=2593676 RepID=UPI001F366569|nr:MULTISPECIES: hypothetical protein [unclassified Streptomyces]MCF0086591.1 hypothetical protein [Streptomyces sp. MH192]MCF0098745.1 hypothetical protein [Streptomyces sp. MH191]